MSSEIRKKLAMLEEADALLQRSREAEAATAAAAEDHQRQELLKDYITACRWRGGVRGAHQTAPSTARSLTQDLQHFHLAPPGAAPVHHIGLAAIEPGSASLSPLASKSASLRTPPDSDQSPAPSPGQGAHMPHTGVSSNGQRRHQHMPQESPRTPQPSRDVATDANSSAAVGTNTAGHESEGEGVGGKAPELSALSLPSEVVIVTSVGGGFGGAPEERPGEPRRGPGQKPTVQCRSVNFRPSRTIAQIERDAAALQATADAAAAAEMKKGTSPQRLHGAQQQGQSPRHSPTTAHLRTGGRGRGFQSPDRAQLRPIQSPTYPRVEAPLGGAGRSDATNARATTAAHAVGHAQAPLVLAGGGGGGDGDLAIVGEWQSEKTRGHTSALYEAPPPPHASAVGHAQQVKQRSGSPPQQPGPRALTGLAVVSHNTTIGHGDPRVTQQQRRVLAHGLASPTTQHQESTPAATSAGTMVSDPRGLLRDFADYLRRVHPDKLVLTDKEERDLTAEQLREIELALFDMTREELDAFGLPGPHGRGEADVDQDDARAVEAHHRRTQWEVATRGGAGVGGEEITSSAAGNHSIGVAAAVAPSGVPSAKAQHAAVFGAAPAAHATLDRGAFLPERVTVDNRHKPLPEHSLSMNEPTLPVSAHVVPTQALEESTSREVPSRKGNASSSTYPGAADDGSAHPLGLKNRRGSNPRPESDDGSVESQLRSVSGRPAGLNPRRFSIDGERASGSASRDLDSVTQHDESRPGTGAGGSDGYRHSHTREFPGTHDATRGPEPHATIAGDLPEQVDTSTGGDVAHQQGEPTKILGETAEHHSEERGSHAQDASHEAHIDPVPSSLIHRSHHTMSHGAFPTQERFFAALYNFLDRRTGEFLKVPLAHQPQAAWEAEILGDDIGPLTVDPQTMIRARARGSAISDERGEAKGYIRNETSAPYRALTVQGGVNAETEGLSSRCLSCGEFSTTLDVNGTQTAAMPGGAVAAHQSTEGGGAAAAAATSKSPAYCISCAKAAAAVESRRRQHRHALLSTDTTELTLTGLFDIKGTGRRRAASMGGASITTQNDVDGREAFIDWGGYGVRRGPGRRSTRSSVAHTDGRSSSYHNAQKSTTTPSETYAAIVASQEVGGDEGGALVPINAEDDGVDGDHDLDEALYQEGVAEAERVAAANRNRKKVFKQEEMGALQTALTSAEAGVEQIAADINTDAHNSDTVKAAAHEARGVTVITTPDESSALGDELATNPKSTSEQTTKIVDVADNDTANSDDDLGADGERVPVSSTKVLMSTAEPFERLLYDCTQRTGIDFITAGKLEAALADAHDVFAKQKDDTERRRKAAAKALGECNVAPAPLPLPSLPSAEIDAAIVGLSALPAAAVPAQWTAPPPLPPRDPATNSGQTADDQLESPGKTETDGAVQKSRKDCANGDEAINKAQGVELVPGVTASDVAPYAYDANEIPGAVDELSRGIERPDRTVEFLHPTPMSEIAEAHRRRNAANDLIDPASASAVFSADDQRYFDRLARVRKLFFARRARVGAQRLVSMVAAVQDMKRDGQRRDQDTAEAATLLEHIYDVWTEVKDVEKLLERACFAGKSIIALGRAADVDASKAVDEIVKAPAPRSVRRCEAGDPLGLPERAATAVDLPTPSTPTTLGHTGTDYYESTAAAAKKKKRLLAMQRQEKMKAREQSERAERDRVMARLNTSDVDDHHQRLTDATNRPPSNTGMRVSEQDAETSGIRQVAVVSGKDGGNTHGDGVDVVSGAAMGNGKDEEPQRSRHLRQLILQRRAMTMEKHMNGSMGERHRHPRSVTTSLGANIDDLDSEFDEEFDEDENGAADLDGRGKDDAGKIGAQPAWVKKFADGNPGAVASPAVDATVRRFRHVLQMADDARNAARPFASVEECRAAWDRVRERTQEVVEMVPACDAELEAKYAREVERYDAARAVRADVWLRAAAS